MSSDRNDLTIPHSDVASLLEMSPEDWRYLSVIIDTANHLRRHILQAKEAGKQQVTINAKPVEDLLSLDVPPEIWLKLGAFLSEKLRKNQETKKDG